MAEQRARGGTERGQEVDPLGRGQPDAADHGRGDGGVVVGEHGDEPRREALPDERPGRGDAFAQLQPALTKIDPVLTKTIQARFTALDTLVGKYRTTANVSGYKLYNQLTTADKRGFAAAVKAVQEPLSKVASKVANA